MTTRASKNFTDVTELPDSYLTQEQYERVHHRYQLAGERGNGKRVLDISCGAGLGLAYLAAQSSFLAGGDFTEHVLQIASRYYRHSIPLVCFDAAAIPFEAAAFELICNFEAIYYFPEPARFLAECQRVLTPDGTLLIGLENQDWPYFVPGPQSICYFSVPALYQLLRSQGFQTVECFGAFPHLDRSAVAKIRATLRRWITQSGILSNRFYDLREQLKPLVYRQMQVIKEVNQAGMKMLPPTVKIALDQPNHLYKVLYFVATK